MKVDFRFSPEGDLELGSPAYNEFDELLYVDSVGETSVNQDDGELVRDIPLQYSFLSEKQVILNRLRTENPDWYMHREIGADLSDLIGMPNTRATGEMGRVAIERCLTYDKFISVSDLSIRPVPLSATEILFHITVTRKAATLVLPVLLNIEHGLLEEYEVKK